MSWLNAQGQQQRHFERNLPIKESEPFEIEISMVGHFGGFFILFVLLLPSVRIGTNAIGYQV